ncbi:hypothetical protein [Staphylococcus edaphicus]|uniref:Uncharacterized protein n=1 Tax=Staphylococcus edaphicus TaxID=1955013 RepID=A0ABY4QAR7_9STAP|nr:hypothetical protein [Staphylococcus edaphicus]UQW81457.1 hypothetical protein MNY58_13010 [Staphylococcus edaphicus]
MEILLGILIKTIDVIVAIASFFERTTSKLLSKLLSRKDKGKNKEND